MQPIHITHSVIFYGRSFARRNSVHETNIRNIKMISEKLRPFSWGFFFAVVVWFPLSSFVESKKDFSFNCRSYTHVMNIWGTHTFLSRYIHRTRCLIIAPHFDNTVRWNGGGWILPSFSVSAKNSIEKDIKRLYSSKYSPCLIDVNVGMSSSTINYVRKIKIKSRRIFKWQSHRF